MLVLYDLLHLTLSFVQTLWHKGWIKCFFGTKRQLLEKCLVLFLRAQPEQQCSVFFFLSRTFFYCLMLYESNQIWVETAFKLGTVAVNHYIQYPKNISTRLIYFNSAWEIFTYEFIKQTWQLQMQAAVLMQKRLASLFSVIHDPWYFLAVYTVTDRWKCPNRVWWCMTEPFLWTFAPNIQVIVWIFNGVSNHNKRLEQHFQM